MVQARAIYYDPSGSGAVIFDSDDAVGGCIADLVALTGSVQNKSYAAFAGKTATPIFHYGFSPSDPTVSYSLGYPVITFPAMASGIPGGWLVVMF